MLRRVLPSGLSMLWETVEPGQALRTRFGFDGFGAAVDWVSTTLTEVWAITVAGCDRVVISDRNAIIWVETGHGPLVVKWSSARDRFANLAASARLSQRLARLGVPVAPPMEAADGQVRVVRDSPHGSLSVAVLPQVVGDWLDVADDVAVRAAGACLADLHRALHGYSDERLVRKTETETETEALSIRMNRWLTDADPGWAPSASSRLKNLLTGLPPLHDEPQLVHNDFRAANILTKDSQITAVLDFDDVLWNHRVSDLAKASVYLSTRFTNWGPTPVSVRRELRAGYESVRPLRPAEGQWLDALVLWFGIGAIPDRFDAAGWAEAL